MKYKPGTPGQNQEISVCMGSLNAQIGRKEGKYENI